MSRFEINNIKYGFIIHDYGDKARNYKGYNAGDPIQSFALEYLYDLMHIDAAQRKGIRLCDFNNYDGEYVILPTVGLALGIQFSKIPFPKKIIPVFISAHFAKNTLEEEEIEYLRRYEPIGCRDEFSMNLLRKYDIDAYLTGCITSIFPKRIQSKSYNTIYLVDTPNELDRFLPKEIRDNAIKITHLLPFDSSCMTEQDADRLIRHSKKILNDYKENASLVISSRMHALVPCMAMGIPVIATFENISYRFSWLDKYMNFYSSDNFNEINWNPDEIDYENVKLLLTDLFREQIIRAQNKYCKLLTISSFYECREKSTYGNYYLNLIKRIHLYKSGNFSYVIWGCGLIGDIAYDIMKKEFPEAQLVAAIDSFVVGQWHNVPIIKPFEADTFKDSYFILATYSGASDGYKKMNELKKEEMADYIYIATKNG